jgi:hypothetical protein
MVLFLFDNHEDFRIDADVPSLKIMVFVLTLETTYHSQRSTDTLIEFLAQLEQELQNDQRA